MSLFTNTFLENATNAVWHQPVRAYDNSSYESLQNVPRYERSYLDRRDPIQTPLDYGKRDSYTGICFTEPAIIPGSFTPDVKERFGKLPTGWIYDRHGHPVEDPETNPWFQKDYVRKHGHLPKSTRSRSRSRSRSPVRKERDSSRERYQSPPRRSWSSQGRDQHGSWSSQGRDQHGSWSSQHRDQNRSWSSHDRNQHRR